VGGFVVSWLWSIAAIYAAVGIGVLGWLDK
jgi:hypothetical protein